MRINFSPFRSDETIELSIYRDIIVINGESLDFSDLQDESSIERDQIPSKWFAGKVNRLNGELNLTLLLPHGPSPSHERAFPDHIILTEDGPVDLPK